METIKGAFGRHSAAGVRMREQRARTGLSLRMTSKVEGGARRRSRRAGSLAVDAGYGLRQGSQGSRPLVYSTFYVRVYGPLGTSG